MTVRRVARGVGIALAILVAVVAIATMGGVFWLRSERGRAFVGRQITGFVDGKIKGKLTIGHVSGPLWGWMVLEEVKLFDLEGNEAGRVAEIAVQFDPWRAIPHRNHIRRLYLVEPVFQAKPLADGRLHIEVLTRYLRERQRSLRIDGLVMVHARANLPPLKGPLERLDRTRVIGRLFFVEHTRWGRFDLLELDGRMQLEHGPPRPLRADATVRWDPQTKVAADAIHLHPGDSRIEGKVAIHEDRFDLDLTRLHVTARDFHQVVPPEDPPGDIDGRLAVHGKLEHLAVDLRLRPADGAVHLRGHASWPEKLLTATVDHEKLRGAFFPKKPPFVIDSARVQLRVKLIGKGLVGPAVLENGVGSFKNVPFEHGSAAAVFFADGVDFARAGMDIPGGAVSGHAHITFKGLVKLGARVAVSEPKKLLAAVKGKWELPTPPQGKSLLTVDVELNKQPKQKAHLSVKGIGLGRPVARGRDGHPL